MAAVTAEQIAIAVGIIALATAGIYAAIWGVTSLAEQIGVLCGDDRDCCERDSNGNRNPYHGEYHSNRAPIGDLFPPYIPDDSDCGESDAYVCGESCKRLEPCPGGVRPRKVLTRAEACRVAKEIGERAQAARRQYHDSEAREFQLDDDLG